MSIDFSDLEDDFSSVAKKATNKEFAREKFTCESCNGSGFWHGGTNRHGNAKCNTCHGKGYLVTSPEARRKARAASRKTKQNKAEAARKTNEQVGNGALMTYLKEVASWNSFAASLLDQHYDGKVWSEKQIEACRKMYAKHQEKQAERAKEAEARKAAAPEVDLSSIREMFDTIISHGYKRPMYRADGLRIKPGRDGSLYVLTEDRMEPGYYGEQPGYEGKIADNRFLAVRNAEADTEGKLKVIAEDPMAAAIRYGRRTGRCACCGRELTKDESIARGIGPICAERWGLTEMKTNLTKEEVKEQLKE